MVYNHYRSSNHYPITVIWQFKPLDTHFPIPDIETEDSFILLRTTLHIPSPSRYTTFTTKSEPMKITLLTNLSGEIICATYRASIPAQTTFIATQIKPSPEQQVYEIDIPAELSQYILEGTIDREIFNYKVERVGQEAKLVKGPAK
jgi:hypothetical protein